MLRASFLAASIALAAPATASAEPAHVVHGSVTDDHGDPIADATVQADDGSVAISDASGAYELAAAPGAELVVSAPGYVARRLKPADAAHVVLAADHEVIEVTGVAPSQTEPVSYRLTHDELALIAGTDDDVLRAAQALPGVARIPFSFGGLALRGTSPADTAVYLDGIEVPIAFHFGGVTSFYPSDLLSDLTVTPGGFDTEYGRAEGGIVSLTTREPRTDQWRFGGSLDLLSASATAEGPVAGGGVIFGVRRSYIDEMVGPFVSAATPLPSYWDAQIRGSFGDAAQAGRFTPLVFMSIDQLGDRETGMIAGDNHLAITSMFVRAAVPYLRQWGPLALQIVPWFGATDLSYRAVGIAEYTTFARPTYPGGLRATLTRGFSWGHLRGGLDSEGGYLTRDEVDSGDQIPSSTMTWLDAAGWAEARVAALDGRIAIKPGVRVERYGLSHETVTDPRVNFDVTAAPSVVVHGALGVFHQPPDPADLDPDGGNPALESSYYDQASLGVEAALPAGLAASITGYANAGHRLGVTADPPLIDDAGLGPILQLLLDKELGLTSDKVNAGEARGAGLELLAKRHVGPWFGMVAYTLSTSQVTYAPGLGPPEVGWHRFDLDQRNNLNVAGSVALGAWTLGARIQLVSGDPYDRDRCAPVGGMEGWQCTTAYYGGTLPTFFQLDVRADRVWHRRRGDIHLYFDIQNATDYTNVEAREFDSYLVATGDPDQDVNGLPILPFIGVKLVPR